MYKLISEQILESQSSCTDKNDWWENLSEDDRNVLLIAADLDPRLCNHDWENISYYKKLEIIDCGVCIHVSISKLLPVLVEQ